MRFLILCIVVFVSGCCSCSQKGQYENYFIVKEKITKELRTSSVKLNDSEKESILNYLHSFVFNDYNVKRKFLRDELLSECKKSDFLIEAFKLGGFIEVNPIVVDLELIYSDSPLKEILQLDDIGYLSCSEHIKILNFVEDCNLDNQPDDVREILSVIKKYSWNDHRHGEFYYNSHYKTFGFELSTTPPEEWYFHTIDDEYPHPAFGDTTWKTYVIGGGDIDLIIIQTCNRVYFSLAEVDGRQHNRKNEQWFSINRTIYNTIEFVEKEKKEK